MIVADTSKRIGILSTVAMAESGHYQKLIAQGIEAGGAHKDVIHLEGCPGWADMVNAGKHAKLDDPAVVAEVHQKLKERLANLPPDLDTIYLCCTHYPAMMAQITKAYQELRTEAGIREPFAVVDPIKQQAETAADVFMEREYQDKGIGYDGRMMLLTTGNEEQTQDFLKDAKREFRTSQMAVFRADKHGELSRVGEDGRAML